MREKYERKCFFFFQAEDGIRDATVTGVQTCALPISCGIDTEKVTLMVWFIGGAFAGLGGALVAWDTQLDPYLGFVYVIPVFSVVLIGGVGSVYGAIAAALLVGLLQSFIIGFDLSTLIPGAPDLHFPVAYKAAV